MTAQGSARFFYAVFHQKPLDREVGQIDEEVAVKQLHHVAIWLHPADFDGLLHVFGLKHVGVRGSVGKQQAVHAEIPAVGGVAKIAAIGKKRCAIRRFFDQRLVHPIPDKPSLQTWVGGVAERIPVLVEVAQRIAHGVGIFAENDGPGGVHGCHLLHPLDGGIHVGHEIVAGKGFSVGPAAFEVNGPGGVNGKDGITHCVEIAAPSTFIAKRPGHDAGVIFVPLCHRNSPVHMGSFPHGAVSCMVVVVGPEVMGFEVHLIPHIQAVFVAELIKAGVVGVMGGSDGVEIVLLHQLHIKAHRCLRDCPTRSGVCFVAVHPLNKDGFAVDEKLAVFNFYFPEPDPCAHDFNGIALRVEMLHNEGVELGILCAPQAGIWYGPPKVQVGFLALLQAAAKFKGRLKYELFVGVVEGKLNGVAFDFFLTEIAEAHGHVECRLAEVIAKLRVGVKVFEVGLRGGIQEHIAENAAQAPEILVFEVAAVRPTDHLHSQQVVAGLEVVGDVKFSGRHAALAVADFLAVEVNVAGRLHPGKMEKHTPACPCRRHRKEPPVEAGFVFVGGHKRRIYRIGVNDVGINRLPVSEGLPVGGNGNLGPLLMGNRWHHEIGGCGTRVGDQLEAPFSVETLPEGEILAHLQQSRCSSRVEPLGGRAVCRELVPANHLGVLPFLALNSRARQEANDEEKQVSHVSCFWLRRSKISKPLVG